MRHNNGYPKMSLAAVLCAFALIWSGCSTASKPATERAGLVTLRGKPVTLLGEGVPVGQIAPQFTAVTQDMQDKSLTDYRGQTVILSVVPSLDTKVCDTQTRTFNERAAALGENVRVVTISMDLPMAQKRWCGAAGVEHVETLSDYKYWSFAQAFGLRIKESGLLARSLYVIDPNGRIVYEQIVPELTTEPDYDAAIKAARETSGPRRS